ncbi:MAG: family 20 glycosylhydrolase, partial [Bacteroidota bacterium]
LVLKLIDLMSLFKLNKFHFHLTDDEGWRLEIPDLPELTSVGSNRGYTPNEEDHLHPSYGSGPTPGQAYGSGYYSRQDFIDIIKYAGERQIEIIPEFDLPGHARAAIKAMEAYARRTGDDSYLLSEATDTSIYRSIQGYPDNTINVCQESTYKFLVKVVAEVTAMYEEAAYPLTTLHTGGDEVPGGVWSGSPNCAELLQELGAKAGNAEQTKNILSAYFLNRFRDILDQRGIRTAGWEEIAMERVPNETGAYQYVVNPALREANLLPYVWNTLGENVDLPYDLANAGYDVVLCNVNNLYFDLAYTTNPAEPGLYWGGFVDTYKAWAFAPYDLVKTVPRPWYGPGPSEEELRNTTTALRPEAQKHIVGIQGQLWSETVRGPAAQEYYLFPKLLGLAERAWSPTADWEDMADENNRIAALKNDWDHFANRIGQYTLPLLDKYLGGEGVNYRLPPPGARLIDGQLHIRTAFPGQPIRWYFGKDATADKQYTAPIPIPAGPQLEVTLVTESKDGQRKSKEVVWSDLSGN